MQIDRVLKKLNFDLLTPLPGSGEGRSADKIFATMLLHSLYPLIWYATWPCSEKVEFWPFDPQGRGGVAMWGGGVLRTKNLLPCCCICETLYYDMQHDHVLKKFIFDPQGRGRGSPSKIFATVLLHSWFHLILYETWPCSEKVEFKPFHLVSWVGCVCVCGGGGGLRHFFLLPCSCIRDSL